jgi:phage-related protein
VPAVVPVLITAIEKVIPALLPLAANLITSILAGIVQAAPMLIQGAIPIILGLVTGIVKQLPMLLSVGLRVLLAVIQGIAGALPQLIPAMVEAALFMVDALVNALPALIEAGIQLVLALALGLIDAIPLLVEAIPDIITSLITGILGAIPQLILAGVKLIVALVENLPAIIEGIISAVPAIINALVDTLGDPKFWKQLGDAGLMLIEGLWEGIKGAGDWLWTQLSSFFGDVIDNIKGLFGIHSPSTVFAGFGVNMIQGLEKGLTRSNHLGAITADLSKQVTEGFQGSLRADAQAIVRAPSAAPGDDAASVPERTPVIYVQNPFTGEYLLARVADSAHAVLDQTVYGARTAALGRG